MPIKNKNSNPYFDDFNEDKKFAQILFRPGYPVQARELTQIQSIIQNQIDRFGKHIFKEGSQVIPGEIGIDKNLDYVKLEQQFSGIDINVENFKNKKVIGTTSGAIATVLDVVAIEGSDPNTLFIKYDSGESTKSFTGNIANGSNTITSLNVSADNVFQVGAKISGTGIPADTYITAIVSSSEIQISNNATVTATAQNLTHSTSQKFADGEDIITSDSVYNATTVSTDATGKGSRVTLNRGVYFILGYFVLVETQSVILEKYSSTPSAKVGLRIVDEFITELNDTSLVDPALGSPNQNAPGAHRYKIELFLDKIPLDIDLGDSFVELVRLENGNVRNLVIRPQYSELEKTLARRTFDESGDYVVRPFPIQIKEHLNDGTNFGLFSASNGGSADKIAVALEPGKAYVRGFEIEKASTTILETDKARTTENENNSIVPFSLGNYIEVDNVSGLFDLSEYELVNLYDVDKADVGYPGTILGTARVRGVEFVTGTPGNSTAKYNIYLFDIKMNSDSNGPYNFANVRSIGNSGDTKNADIVLNINNEAVIKSPQNSSLLLELPETTISDVSDISYTVKRHQTGAMSGSSITINAGTNEIFNSYSISNYQISIATASGTATGNSFSDGDIIDMSQPGNSVVLGGSPLGKQVTITIPDIADSTLDIISTVTKSAGTEKTKTLTTRTQTLAHSNMIELDKADVYRIVSITDVISSDDITDRYILDNGQRDNFYGLGKLSFKTQYPAPVGNVEIQYEYFEHGAGDFFTVQSYSGVLDYDDIGQHVSKTNGKIYELTDCIDFRPRVNDAGTGFSSVTEILATGENFTCDIEYYVPRNDRVFLDSSGNFKIIKGIPAKSPVFPNVPENGIILYDIGVPSYTPDIKKVSIKKHKNKRYTMRDIGKIDDRVESLEYYSSLNLLEKDTSDLFIDDGTGANRFKSGFLVDNFTSHFVGNVELSEYKCSIDKRLQTLRPGFKSTSVGLDLSEIDSSNYQKTGDVITLPYTTEQFISQPFASKTENVNPYDVFNWVGSVLLSPQSDEWFEVSQAPDRIIESDDGLADSLAALNGQVIWNDWETVWTGVSIVAGQTVTNRTRQFARPNGRDRWPVRDILTIEQLVGTEQGQTRTGTQFTVQETTNTQSLGNRIIDTSVIPFMRENTISFTGTALKPNTTVYPFFDNVNVSEYVTPTGGNLGDPLVTDIHGEVSGTFSIPNNDTVRFRTGERVFKLTDSVNDDRNFATTSAESIYTASGTLRTQEETILSTRSAEVVSTTVTDERTTVGFDLNTITRATGWFDPLAQTFLVEQEGGSFISDIDIFFAQKDTSGVPVTLQIRNVVNGYPGKLILPFATVTLKPEDVNVSTDASVATKFTFPSPVYLENNEEYCFVLLANSIEYLVWVARMGEFDVSTEERISKQPYAGVMFKSQNASTWTADQEQDIKFNVSRCVFNDQIISDVRFKNRDIASQPLPFDPITTTDASNVVNIFHPNHGLQTGDDTVISGVSGTQNNIPDTELNGTHSITYVDFDNYTITVTTNADATGATGGATVRGLGNIKADVINPLFETINLPQTTLGWDLKLTDTAKLLHTNFVPFETKSNVNFLDERIIYSPENEPTGKSALVRARLSTDNPYISPVIDTQRASLICVTNRINNDATDELLPESGNALARYITKKITLENPATSARVYLSAIRPPLAEIKVYIKHLPNSDNDIFNDRPYVELNQVSYPQGNEFSLRDYVFEIDSLEAFSTYAIKIVMISQETSDVPIIKDFRTIALQ